MTVQIAGVTFDAKQRILKKGSQSRNLEPKVFSLLTELLHANGQIVTRDQLIVSVWKNRIVGEGAINRTVSLLRSHFSALTDEDIVETVPTQGYRLIATVVEILAQPPLVNEVISTNTQPVNTSLKHIKTPYIIVIITLVILISLSLFSYFGQTTTATKKNELALVSGPLIGLKGWEYLPSATQSGQKILFHHLDASKQQSVYLYDIKTHNKQKLLTNALAAINADGESIVYSTNTNGECSIVLYKVLTDKTLTLFPCDEPPTKLIWGQNDTFYFNKRFSKSHPYQIFSYNVNTSRLQQITKPSSSNNTKGDFNFAYNKQSNQLAVARYINEKKSKIIVIGQGEKRTEHTVNLPAKSLVWHPNENALIIADNHNLYSLAADGQLELLKQLTLKISSLAILPSKAGNTLLVSSSNVMSEIVKYDIADHNNSVWQESARTELLPRMQADRKLVLSTRYKSHHWWQIEGDNAKLIDVDFPFDLAFVRYELSADGKRLLFTKHDAVFELDIDKLSYKKLFNEPHKSYVANYDSRNKYDVIYSSNHSGQWQLWQYQRATGEHSQLTYRGGYSGRIIGQYLYYSKFTVDGLWRKKLTEPNEELIIKDFSRINWLNWHVINNKLYFYREATGIWQFDINTDTEQLLMAKPDNWIHQYTVSPDQQHIFWVRFKPVEGDIYQYTF